LNTDARLKYNAVKIRLITEKPSNKRYSRFHVSENSQV
jgi:hypothetical protein